MFKKTPSFTCLNGMILSRKLPKRTVSFDLFCLSCLPLFGSDFEARFENQQADLYWVGSSCTYFWCNECPPAWKPILFKLNYIAFVWNGSVARYFLSFSYRSTLTWRKCNTVQRARHEIFRFAKFSRSMSRIVASTAVFVCRSPSK